MGCAEFFHDTCRGHSCPRDIARGRSLWFHSRAAEMSFRYLLIPLIISHVPVAERFTPHFSRFLSPQRFPDSSHSGRNFPPNNHGSVVPKGAVSHRAKLWP